jgi:phage terminase small subunit
MKGHGEKLTRKQEALIAALLLAPTLGAATQQAGVSAVTAWRWLKDPDVQAAYRAARREVVRQAIAQVQQACSEAVTTLRTTMADTTAPASARVSAARTVLETAIKAVELEDLEGRVQALEQARAQGIA